MPKGIPAASPTCSLDGCEEKHHAYGYCRGHAHERQRKPCQRCGGPKEPGRRRRFCEACGGGEVGYGGVHHRLRKLYGDATEHACRQCGNRADTWAYDHADPNERQDPKRGPYSIDLAHYLPLCHSCHVELDRKAPPKTHCVNGHPFTVENTYWRKSGWRDCRACNRERARRNALGR